MKKINWGIVGLGHIANQFANAFSIIDNAKIKGIASCDKDKLQSFKKRFNQFSHLFLPLPVPSKIHTPPCKINFKN